jgi:hypothetical protein
MGLPTNKDIQKLKSIITCQIACLKNEEEISMAAYVLLMKEEEAEEFVIYKFGPDKDRLGKLRLNKVNGEPEEIEQVPDTTTNFYYFSAASKLIRILKEGDGIFPDTTSFAS